MPGDGAGQGIGRAIVDQFVGEGATGIASDISEEKFGELPREAMAEKYGMGTQHPHVTRGRLRGLR